MEKRKRKILFASVLFAAAVGTGITLPETVAKAAPSALPLQLVSPLSYEEYLPLVSPTDVSATEKTTAIADGKTLYVYDVEKESYRSYEHADPISKLQIVDEQIYFLSKLNLYRIDCDALQTAESVNVTCQTFAIEEDWLYYRISEFIEKAPLTNAQDVEEVEDQLLTDEFTPLAFWDGSLCYFKNGALYREDEPKPIASFPYQVSSMTITGDVVALTSGGNLYAYNLNELNGNDSAEESQLLTEQLGSYKSVCAYQNTVYATDSTSVKKWTMTADGFLKQAEICNASSSLNRLHGSKGLTLTGNKLFTLDNGNNRVSVYDVASGEYSSPLSTSLTPVHIASDGKTALLSEEGKAILYSLTEEEYGSPLANLENVHGQIVGLTSVYGKYYVLTNTNHCYLFEKDSAGWTIREQERKSTFGKKLTSDVYGYLYLLSDTGIYRYSEEEFLDPNGMGERLFSTLPANVKEIGVDYGQNVYLLTETSLFQYQTDGYTQTEYSLSTPLVYDKTPAALSFALSAENNTAYLLFEGDYLAKTNGLELPSASTLPTENAYEQIHGESTELQLVVAKSGAVLIEFSASDLKADTIVFPYLGFTRLEEEKRAIKLGETGKYQLLTIVGDEKDRTYLALTSDCTELEKPTYEKTYEKPKTGYVSNDVPLFKFPCVNFNLPSVVENVDKDQEIELLSELSLEKTYYLVRLQTQEGTKTGYIPSVYVSLFNGEPPESENRVYGDTDSNADSVWRFWYILLGTGAICILVDFLLLRNHKEDAKEE